MFHIRHADYLISENHPMQMRRHQGLYEFYMLLYCHSPLTVYTANGEAFAKPGSFILYSPHKPQYWDAAPPRFLHSYVTFTVDDPAYFNELNIPLDEPVYPNMNKEITQTIKSLVTEIKEQNIGKDYMIDHLLNGLFVDIARRLHANAPSRSGYEENTLARFEQVRFEMYQNPSRTIEEYATGVGFSVRRFQQYYKQFFDIVPSADLAKARYVLAQELVSQGKTPQKIAPLVGFESPEYFAKWYRKMSASQKGQTD